MSKTLSKRATLNMLLNPWKVYRITESTEASYALLEPISLLAVLFVFVWISMVNTKTAQQFKGIFKNSNAQRGNWRENCELVGELVLAILGLQKSSPFRLSNENASIVNKTE